MITNRIKEYVEEPEEQLPGDYYVVECYGATFCVSKETAEMLSRRIGRRLGPRFIRFTDLYGSEHFIQARQIYQISSSTAEQRSRARSFYKARQQEENADSGFEDGYA